jgi:hypothetical protein
MWVWPENILKPILYIFLWIAKLSIFPFISDLKLYRAKNVTLPVPKKFVMKCKTIFWIRKLEFVLFNMVLADALFLGSRCVGGLKLNLFTTYLDGIDDTWEKLGLIMCYFISMLTVIAVTSDFMELFSISLKVWSLEHVR